MFFIAGKHLEQEEGVNAAAAALDRIDATIMHKIGAALS